MTPQQVCEKFAYTPSTGVVIHRRRVGKVFAGQPVGSCNKSGYLHTRNVAVHRIAWCLHNGAWPDGLIDHVDRDKLNNRIGNLRVATKAQNMHNSGTATNNTSGVRGVYRKSGKWVAQIKHGGKTIHLGRFVTLDAAAKARAEAEKTIWKEY